MRERRVSIARLRRTMAGPLCAFALSSVLGWAGPADADSRRPAAQSPAGLRFDIEVRGQGRHERVTVYVAGRRVRIEQRTAGEKRDAHVLVYRGDENRFLSIDPVGRAYMEVDRGMIAAAGLATQTARREVDARLDRLPPSMHAALVALLGAGDSDAGVSQQPIEVRNLEGTDRVGPFTCRKRELLHASKRIAELCVTKWSEIGLLPRDLEVFRGLANFQRELMGAQELTPLALVPNQSMELLVQFDGFPLYLRGVGVLSGEIRVRSVETVDDTAGLFGPPTGYAARSVYSLFLGMPASPAPSDESASEAAADAPAEPSDAPRPAPER